MNYDALTREYWEKQVARVEALRARINTRAVSTDGRVIPEAEDLEIGTGRRMQLAVMFLDICGFSRRPSESPEEQDMMLRVLNLFFSEMIKIAEEYGATVEKNTGDGLMAYFEDSGTSSADSGTKRAVACALTMMAANKYLIRPILRATPVPEIDYRISIDYGPVTIARLGAARRFNSIVAIGATANVAAKMLAKAGAGDIVLGASARSQLPTSWRELHTIPTGSPTGWEFRANGNPYPLYYYTGRWATLLES